MKKFFFLIILLLPQFIFCKWEELPGWVDYDVITEPVRATDTIVLKYSTYKMLISTDNGKIWKIKQAAMIDGQIENINNLLFFGNILVIECRKGIYFSYDLGDTWVSKNTGIEAIDINSIFENNGKIYIGSNSGLYYSDELGENWNKIDTKDLPSLNLIILYANEDQLWVECVRKRSNFNVPDTINVFFTPNFGSSWELIKFDSSDLINAHPTSNPNKLFTIYNGTIYLSNDRGTSWEIKNNGIEDAYVEQIATQGDTIFAATDKGVYSSFNNGDVWTLKNWKLRDAQSLLISDNKILLIGPGLDELYESSDFGETWVLLYKLQIYGEPRAIISYNNTLYIGSKKLGISTDNGTTWFFNENLKVDTTIYSIAVSGRNIYVGTQVGLFMSSDNGLSWEIKANDLLKSKFSKQIFSVVIYGDNIFASVADGILKSTDKGSNWEFKKIANNHYVNPVCISEDGILYVGSYGEGLFISTDLGITWVVEQFTNSQIKSLAILGDNVYVGSEVGFFISTDKGETWENTGLSFYYNNYSTPLANSILIYKDIFFIANDKNGVFVSTDMGNSFEARNEGLILKGRSSSSAITVNDDYIFVSLCGMEPGINCLFRAKINDLVSNVREDHNFTSNSSIYPNPAGDYIYINSPPIDGVGGVWQYQIYDLLR